MRFKNLILFEKRNMKFVGKVDLFDSHVREISLHGWDGRNFDNNNVVCRCFKDIRRDPLAFLGPIETYPVGSFFLKHIQRHYENFTRLFHFILISSRFYLKRGTII